MTSSPFSLDGLLLAVARPDLVGVIDKGAHGLIEVPVDIFAGFIFLNPDRDAKSLAEFLTPEVASGLAPYKLDEMIPVGMDVREELECNWKVVIDAFSEGHHIIGVHPELLAVIDLEAGNARHGFFGDPAFPRPAGRRSPQWWPPMRSSALAISRK